METNTNTAVIENTDGEMTKTEHITKLLWWMFGITAVRLLLRISEFTGNYQSLPDQADKIISFIIPAAAAIVLFKLGKYGKLYKASGILMGASVIAQLLMFIMTIVFPSDSGSFLDLLRYSGVSSSVYPLYSAINSLSFYSKFAAFVLMCLGHRAFIKPVNAKLGKAWSVPVIIYGATYVLGIIFNTVQLYFPVFSDTPNAIVSIYRHADTVFMAFIFIALVMRTVLLPVTIKKFNANQEENEAEA